jgi:hypothetical protein
MLIMSVAEEDGSSACRAGFAALPCGWVQMHHDAAGGSDFALNG